LSLFANPHLNTSLEVARLLDVVRLPRAGEIVLPASPDARVEQIAIIAHELRNSLGVMRNAARVLRFEKSAAGIDGARLLIERHVGQMSRHVEDLLDTTLLSGRFAALRLAHLDLRLIVEHSLEAIRTDMSQRGHHLVIDLPAAALWVHADGSRLEQVISNLLINAAKYTPDGGDIRLVMERLDQQASIRIRDSGIGMAPAMLARVFEMYAQVDALAPRAEGGHGIGLTVVRDLVEMHGGSVSAMSTGLGSGSEFTVLLPSPWAPPVAPWPAPTAG